jgi:hypothetical protein
MSAQQTPRSTAVHNPLSLYVYGGITIAAGLVLGSLNSGPFNTLKLTLGFTLVAGAIFAFATGFQSKRSEVKFAYHELHALAMMGYGVSIMLFCETMENLLFLTAFLFLFYALSEIILSSWMFNMGKKVSLRVLVLRVALGVFLGLGTVVAMNDTGIAVEVFSVLFAVAGINVLLYVPIIKSQQAFSSHP